MSHQTVATIRTLLAQITASIAYIMFKANSQPMIERVATFLARQCQGKGSRSDNAAMKATGANSGSIESEEKDIQEEKSKTELYDLSLQ